MGLRFSMATLERIHLMQSRLNIQTALPLFPAFRESEMSPSGGGVGVGGTLKYFRKNNVLGLGAIGIKCAPIADTDHICIGLIHPLHPRQRATLHYSAPLRGIMQNESRLRYFTKFIH